MENSKFENVYKQIVENITTDTAGIGATSTSHDSGDTYAPGDAREPVILNPKTRKKKLMDGKPQVIKRPGLNKTL